MSMLSAFRLDREHLLELAAAHHDAYVGAEPFPHIVLDDFLPESVVDEVIAEFPSPEEDGWLRFASEHERKLASARDTRMGDATRHLLAEFNSAAYLDFLGALTGIAGLIPDPYLEGGGMHQILAGGHLDVHVDFNRHPATGLDRRLNAILYLNRDWQPEWEGALELWSPDMQRCVRSVLPQYNRLVVFSTTEHSFHGHPHTLACPPDRTRRSLALYYYSNGRPEEAGRRAETHNTMWGEAGADPAAGRRRRRAKHLASRIAPPVLLDAVRAARGRRQG